MSNIFLENFLLWLVFGVGAAASGYALSQGLGRRIYFISSLVVGAAIAALGAVLVFAVDTPSKSIKRTIYGIESALQNNDPDGVAELIAGNAAVLKKIVRNEMGRVSIERARVSGLKIDEINMTTSPPRARISCRGMVSGKTADGYQFTGMERFRTIELRLEPDNVWRVTDKFEMERGF